MRPPTMIVKSLDGFKFRIRYRQVPFIDRYFFVDISYPDGHYLCKHSRWRKEYMKIRKFPGELPDYYMFGFLVLTSQRQKLDDFMKKVEEYDKYLDLRD